MKFSTRSTYGLRAMTILARQKNGQSISLSRIAKSEKISQGYLEKIFSFLKKAKLVRAEKGTSGGYKLAKPAGAISVFEIVEALEGEKTLFHCFIEKDKVHCGAKCNCGVSSLLVKMKKAIESAFKDIKLSEL